MDEFEIFRGLNVLEDVSLGVVDVLRQISVMTVNYSAFACVCLQSVFLYVSGRSPNNTSTLSRH